MNSAFDLQPGNNDQARFARSAIGAVPVSASGTVVNRTHRVVRERARVMQERRTRARSLMLPLFVSAALLTLSVMAVWTGLYQYQTVEAVEADVSALATADANNHFLVVLLWFVPVSLAVLSAVWVRRSRKNTDDEVF